MKKLGLLMAALAAMAVLASCSGGGDSGQPQVQGKVPEITPPPGATAPGDSRPGGPPGVPTGGGTAGAPAAGTAGTSDTGAR